MNDLAIQELSNSDVIRSRIFTIRGVQVILSSDLAPLYDVEVKYLHRQVKRNANRFPSDFILHLSPEEANVLRCQNVTSKRGGDRYGVLAFTEQGVAMLSSVLKSERATEGSDSTAVAAPCGGLRPIGRCACAEGVRLAETAGRAAKRAQGPTQTRRAKRVPSSQVQFSMKEVA